MNGSTAYQGLFEKHRLPQFSVQYLKKLCPESVQLGLLLEEFEEWNKSQRENAIRYNVLYFVYKSLWKMISITPYQQRQKSLLWLRSNYSQLIQRHLLLPQQSPFQTLQSYSSSFQPTINQCKPTIKKRRIKNQQLNTKVRARRKLIVQDLKKKLSRSQHSFTNISKVNQIKQDVSTHSLSIQNEKNIKFKINKQFGKKFQNNFFSKVVPVKQIEEPQKIAFQKFYLENIHNRRVISRLKFLNFQEDTQPPRPSSKLKDRMESLNQMSIQEVQEISSKVRGVNSAVLRMALVSPQSKQLTSFSGISQQLIDLGPSLKSRKR